MIKRGRLIAGLAALALTSLLGCGEEVQREVGGGDADRGPALMRSYGCHACHTIPGVAGADALVGPPLVHWSRRVYIAGRIANTPENLVRWIMDPRAIDERTAMPEMGVTESDARDIAAYLWTLE